MKDTGQTKSTAAIVPIAKNEIIPEQRIDDLMDLFLSTLDVRPITKEIYRKGVVKFFEWMRANDTRQPDRRTILAYKTYLAELDLSPNTKNSYLSSVKVFFTWIEAERIGPNVAKGIKGFENPSRYLRETPSPKQVRKMLDEIDRETNQGRRNFALINLLARTGLRSIEVVRANIEDMRIEGDEALLYIQGKGKDSKGDFVLLTELTLDPIREYLETRPDADPADPLFVSLSDRNKGERLTTRTIRRIAKNLFREIGLDDRKLSCHSFRHFFATETLRNDAPLIQVQTAMRHASIQTTQRYLHAIDRVENGAERFINF